MYMHQRIRPVSHVMRNTSLPIRYSLTSSTRVHHRLYWDRERADITDTAFYLAYGTRSGASMTVQDCRL